jgi:hypothetical protein
MLSQGSAQILKVCYKLEMIAETLVRGMELHVAGQFLCVERHGVISLLKNEKGMVV